jgi:hypothetical protein
MIAYLKVYLNSSISVDEGSYEPDPQLKKVREMAEESLKIAHSMNLVKTKVEADNEPEKDD